MVDDADDPLAAIDLLRAEGFDAQPDHVFFAHQCGNPCPPHPALVQELVEYGLLANPMHANPMHANPMHANHSMESSAVPAAARRYPVRELFGTGPYPTVIVLDTGLASVAPAGIVQVDHRAPVLVPGMTAMRISGPAERPDDTIAMSPPPAQPPDGYLDPVAGHGTFIAGIIEQLAPGCIIEIRHVVGPLGDAVESNIAAELHDIIDDVVSQTYVGPVIINMSFGGHVMDAAGVLREAVAKAAAAGIVMVASAGNEGTFTPQFPAAFPNVVGVAALGPDGPAPWTNYGDWVDACAPGTDLVSAFFNNFNGTRPRVNTLDPDRFTGWAEWSGTSFATPVVVAAIARELVCGIKDAGPPPVHLTAREATDSVVNAPHLARLACLGTVINL